MQEGFSYIPENYFDTNDEKEKEKKEEKEEEIEIKEQKNILIDNVVNTINIITNNSDSKEEEEIIEEFVPGIINDRFKLFCHYRSNYQNKYFHLLENNIVDETKKLLDDLFIINNNQTRLLNYNEIELQNISYNLNSSNYEESYKEVNKILEDLLINFASLKSLQQERIKPKFEDGEEENRKLDSDIKKLKLKMIKKIKFCEALVKMEKVKNINNNIINNSSFEEKIKNNIKLLLMEKIQNFSNEFRRNEQHFISYLKEMGDVDYSQNDNNFDINKNIVVIEGDNLYNEFLYTQEDDIKSQITKRDKDINVLTNNVNELSKIFKDLQMVVQEQGTILDRIDYNIDTSYGNSQKGLKYIQKAEEHHNNSCFRNLILLLFTIIFIETIFIIFKML